MGYGMTGRRCDGISACRICVTRLDVSLRVRRLGLLILGVVHHSWGLMAQRATGMRVIPNQRLMTLFALYRWKQQAHQAYRVESWNVRGNYKLSTVHDGICAVAKAKLQNWRLTSFFR
jgi:hypothetical protein